MRKKLRNRLLDLLNNLVEVEVIGQEECPMMLRWTFLRIGPSGKEWVKAMIHHFPADVSDRDPHDHPRPFITLVLRGMYRDTQYDPDPVSETLVAGDFRYRPARYTHIVQTYSQRSAWTLVVMGPVIREWGFLRFGEWIPFREYIKRYGGVTRCEPEPRTASDYKGTPPPFALVSAAASGTCPDCGLPVSASASTHKADCPRAPRAIEDVPTPLGWQEP